MSKLPFFVLQGVLLSSSALAASLNCNGHISCTDLGYSKNDVSGCTNYLYCPFDNAYKVCLPDCEDSGDCPSGSSRMTLSQCNGMGGIALYDTTATSDSVCCHMCQSGYEKLYENNSQGFTCTNETYITLDGGRPTKCCKSCPDGTEVVSSSQCSANGGILVNPSIVGSQASCCQTCPDGYTMTNQFAGLTCNSTIYNNKTEGGAPYQCCLACPDGKMWEHKCSSGIFKDADSNGCGTCEQCPDGYTVSSDKTKCIPSCQKGCPEDAKFISSADEITTDHNSYCLAKSITLNNSNATIPLPGGGAQLRSLKFYSGCNVTLTVNAKMSGLVSYVNTVIDQGADVYNLELHTGGTFNTSMAPNSASGTTKACQVKLLGGHTYKFTYIKEPDDSRTEVLPQVTCGYDSCSSNIAGCNTQSRPKLEFDSKHVSTAGSWYRFNNCNAQCYLNNTCGSMSSAPDTSGNYCDTSQSCQ